MSEPKKKKRKILVFLMILGCLNAYTIVPGYAQAQEYLGTSGKVETPGDTDTTGGAEQGEGEIGDEELTLFSSALTPELELLAATAGYIHQPFSSTVESYEMTLGPQETGFSLIASPVEKTDSPTAEVFLDGAAEVWCQLSFGEPSPLIPLEPGQSRSVRVRSTSHAGNVVRNYTIEVHRTEVTFVWSPGEMRQTADGGEVLPVVLSVPGGTGMKDLSFALGFDPAKLALSDESGTVTDDLYRCVQPTEGFEYVPKRGGYFTDLSSQADNEAGVLRVQYGPGSASVGAEAYTAKESGELLTVWFRVLEEGTGQSAALAEETARDSLFILQSGVTPCQGIAMTDEINRVLQCAGMVTIEGQSNSAPDDPADPAVTGPALGVLELYLEGGGLTGPKDDAGQHLDRRYLVSTGTDGRENFGFRPEVSDYGLYLFPGEEAELILRSEADVTGITAGGLYADGGIDREIGLIGSAGGTGGVTWWEERMGKYLTLDLGGGEEGRTVTLLLTDGAGEQTRYTITLHRADRRPSITIAASGGAVTAAVENTRMREAAFSLILTPEAAQRVTAGGIRQRLEAELKGSGLAVAEVELTGAAVSGPGGSEPAPEGAKELRIVLDTGGPAIVSTLQTPLTVRLFEGGMGDILSVGEDEANTVSDVRFGSLQRITALKGSVRLTGTILAYDGARPPKVTLYEAPAQTEAASALEGDPAEVVLTSGQNGFGLKTFTFTTVLTEGTEYTMGVTKDGHTACRVSGIVLTEDSTAKPLRLYAGDLDGDGWVSAFDADALAFHLGRGERGAGEKARYDLDGDGGETIFDLDLLTSQDNYGGRDRTLEWSAVREGGDSQ